MKTNKLATQIHFGGGNFTRLLCALLITLISLPAVATPYKNLYVHAEAYPNGAGKVFIEPKNEEDKKYIFDKSSDVPAQTFDYKATIGESFSGDKNNSGDCLNGKGMYAVKFTATAAPGYKLKCLSSRLKDGTPDEDSFYSGHNNGYDPAFGGAWGEYGPQFPIINVNNPDQESKATGDGGQDAAYAKWTGTEDIDTYVYAVFEDVIFTVNGLKYQQTSETEVRVRGYEGTLPSKLVIPATINYDNKTFNVTKIEAGAFGDCSNIEEVFVNSTSIIEISENTFANLSAGTKLYVPFGNAYYYRATGENKWGRFKEIIETSFDGTVPETVGNTFAGVVVNANYEKEPVSSVVKNYSLTDGADMVTLQNDFTAENVTYSRAMSTTWGSVCLPFALASNDDVKYFELTEVSAEALTFSPVETVAANTPVFFKRLNNNNYTATVANAEVKKLAGAGHPSKEAITGWTAEGVYKAETVKAATGNVSYFIYNDTFYYTEGNMNMTPFRAYFTVQQANSPQSTLRINEDLHPTDVQEIRENADGTVTVIFDLNGRRLSEPQRGAINIVNGKKVLVK